MLERILPPQVEAATCRGDVATATLFPEERALVERAVEKRRLEFATGRDCARRALLKLGLPPVAIPWGDQGEPTWPAGIVGSITHCAGYRAAAVASSSAIFALGIDAEPNQPLPDRVLGDIASPDEGTWVRTRLSERPEVRWDRLLFCMKEAVYKAWFPLTGRWLGFEDAVVEVDSRLGSFNARLLVPAVDRGRPLSGFTGRWLAEEGILAAAIAMPAADS